MKNKSVYKICVLPSGDEIEANHGEVLLDVLTKNGAFVISPCGGRGSCGKCKVKLISGKVEGQTQDEKGYILSCKSIITGDITVELSEGITDISVIKKELSNEKNVYAALDIGTTTLAASLIGRNGDTLATASSLNPQAAFGADVLSRINACNEGKLEILKELVTAKARELINEMRGETRVTKLYVTANTVMLHIFLGISPRSIGVYPFKPVFTETQYRQGSELSLPVDEICVLPSASGYIGSDAVAGAVYLNMQRSKATSLLVDIGTNGELLLTHGGNYYAASCAAGPALEGACIECGVGGIEGAISRIDYKNGELFFKTVNDASPIGICGSALIDLISILTEEGVIDETGAFYPDSCSPLNERLKGERFYLTDCVYLSSGDVRQFQLAKAAIRAGVESLIAETKITENDISDLYIAGGLGEYMSIKSAERVGLISARLSKKASIVGNTSLLGAAAVSIGDISIEKVSEFAAKVKTVDLSASEVFRQKFIDNMYFP